MRSSQLLNMSRFYSKVPSVRLAFRTKSTLPAILACRTQLLLPTSPIPRTAFFLQQQPFQFNTYSTGYGDRSDGTSTQNSGPFPPSSNIYVGNIPFDATAEDIKYVFGVFGGLKRISFGLQPDGRSRGFAHVEFDTVEEANAVLSAHQQSPLTVGERTVAVAYGGGRSRDSPRQTTRRGFRQELKPSHCLYVGSLPYDAGEQDIKDQLEQFGTITSIRIACDHQGQSKGFAHVDFTSVEEAERVYQHYQTSSIKILGRDVRVDRANPPVTEHPPSPRLYFRGFPGSADQLREAMGEFGSQAIDVVLLKNMQTGIQTGAGFVQFGSTETAADVIKMLHGQTLMNGKKFEVAFAKPRDLRDGRPDGGSRSGFGLRDSRRSNRDDDDGWNDSRDSRMPIDPYGSGWKN